MSEDATGPTRGEAIALAVAGPAFAAALLLLRKSTPAPTALFDAAAVLALALGLAPILARTLGAPAASALRGVSAVGAALVLAPSFGLADAALPLATGLAGLTILQASSHAERASSAIATVGVVLFLSGLGIAFFLANAFPESARLRATLALAAGLSLAGVALRAWWVRSRHASSAPRPLGLVLGAGLLATYVGYRPLAAATVANLPLYEWGLAVGGALLVFGRIRRIARESESPESWSMDARRHAQDVRPMYDARMTPMAAVLQRYLDHGEGFDAYLRTIEASHGTSLPRDLIETLEAGRSGGKRLPRARKAATARRLAAHDRALARLTEPRG